MKFSLEVRIQEKVDIETARFVGCQNFIYTMLCYTVWKFLRPTYLRDGNSFIHATYVANTSIFPTGSAPLPSHFAIIAVMSAEMSLAASLSDSGICEKFSKSQCPSLFSYVHGLELNFPEFLLNKRPFRP